MDIPSLFSTKSAACPSDNLVAWLGEHCDSVMIAGRAFPSYRLFIIGIGIIMIAAIILLLQRSRLGMIIRAGVQDSEMVEALGINVRRVFTLVFAIGAALAGLGGVVAAPFLGVYPGMAMEFLLQAFIVVVIGGLGSIPGAAIGALLVGLARAYGDHIVLSGIQLPGMSEAISGSPAIARASTVLIMAIVLFIKPTGIFGTKE
jgi:branched-chain amino acid transport system permease protein